MNQNTNKVAELKGKLDGFLGGFIEAASEEARSESLHEYLRAQARFHTYSWRNTALILMQRHDATRVAGFHSWKNNFGRYVKKGEHGIAILCPRFGARKATAAELASGAADPDGKVRWIYFVPGYVFDLAQTDGRALPECGCDAATGDDHGALAQLLAKAEQMRVRVEFGETVDAKGFSAGGYVRISAKLDPAGRAEVLAHELAHEMLHQGENRRGAQEMDRGHREAEAEAVSYVVCTALGIPAAKAARYVAMWNRGDAKTVKARLQASFARVTEAARSILNEAEATESEAA